jgi:hypothetical protein
MAAAAGTHRAVSHLQWRRLEMTERSSTSAARSAPHACDSSTHMRRRGGGPGGHERWTRTRVRFPMAGSRRATTLVLPSCSRSGSKTVSLSSSPCQTGSRISGHRCSSPAPARRAPPGRADSPGHVCNARIGRSRSTAAGRNADTPTASCLDSGGLSQKALVSLPSFATAPLSAALFGPPHSFIRTRVEEKSGQPVVIMRLLFAD